MNSIIITMINMIKSMLGSVSGMKIEEKEKNLEKKLHQVAEHIIGSKNQFESWMQLQNKLKLHQNLKQLYSSIKTGRTDYPNPEEQISYMIQLFTLLLTNCSNELLVAKLVSDDLVIDLALMSQPHTLELDEINPYRINLFKAYLAATNQETIKYMVINDRFMVFEECVRMLEQPLGMVEHTTLGSIILNLLQKSHHISFLSESMWSHSGLVKLFTSLGDNMMGCLQRYQFFEAEEYSLFIMDVAKQLKNEELYEKANQFFKEKFIGILQIVFQFPNKNNVVHSLSIIYPIFSSYRWEDVIVEQCLGRRLSIIVDCIENISTQSPLKIDFMTRSFDLLCRLLSAPNSNLSIRNDPENTHQHFRQKTSKIVTQILSKIISQNQKYQTSELQSLIKYSMLTLLKICLGSAEATLDKQTRVCILKLFQEYLFKFRKILENNKLWDSIIKWYSKDSDKIVQDLLVFPSHYESIKEDSNRSLFLTLEYIRNYRYMLITETSLQSKSIKFEKSHFSEFNSEGCSLQPGQITEEPLPIICAGVFHHNSKQIPVGIVKDSECLILAYKQEEGFKIIINVKFKDIEEYVYGNQKDLSKHHYVQNPKFVKILLRGIQEIFLEFIDPKKHGNIFRQYIIRQKDLCRQRELTFLSTWLIKYEKDTQVCLQNIEQQ